MGEHRSDPACSGRLTTGPGLSTSSTRSKRGPNRALTVERLRVHMLRAHAHSSAEALRVGRGVAIEVISAAAVVRLIAKRVRTPADASASIRSLIRGCLLAGPGGRSRGTAAIAAGVRPDGCRPTSGTRAPAVGAAQASAVLGKSPALPPCEAGGRRASPRLPASRWARVADSRHRLLAGVDG